MSLINWSSNFSVEVEEIDQQHKMLLKRINELHEATLAGEEKTVLGKLINQLTVYAAFHFAKEEHYFDMFGYPETNIHKKQHDDFERKVTQFEHEFKAGRQDLSMDVIRFLAEWLINHIRGSDQKYVLFFKERGLK